MPKLCLLRQAIRRHRNIESQISSDEAWATIYHALRQLKSLIEKQFSNVANEFVNCRRIGAFGKNLVSFLHTLVAFIWDRGKGVLIAILPLAGVDDTFIFGHDSYPFRPLVPAPMIERGYRCE